MKKLVSSIIVIVFSIYTVSAYTVSAQNEKYVREMTLSIEAMKRLDKATPDVDSLLEIAHRFERIAVAEPKEWLPRYYAAYCYVLLGFVGKTLMEKDQFLDKAEVLLKDSEIIQGKPTDEVLVMKAYAAQIRLAADAQNRWQTEGEKFEQLLTQAKGLNADNPRIYYLEGSSLFFTPEQFGGGKKVAKPLLEKANEKFSAFKPESSIHPDWGQAETKWMLSQSDQ